MGAAGSHLQPDYFSYLSIQSTLTLSLCYQFKIQHVKCDVLDIITVKL